MLAAAAAAAAVAGLWGLGGAGLPGGPPLGPARPWLPEPPGAAPWPPAWLSLTMTLERFTGQTGRAGPSVS